MSAESNATVDRTELDERIRRSWDELLQAVGALDDGLLTAPGPEEWSVKDHLAHVARWEEYLLAALEGRDPAAALGLPGGQDEDAENAVLYARDAGLSAEEVRRLLADTHAAVVARLRTADDADLQRHLELIEGDTWKHFDEHRGWIGALLAAGRT